jgi:hypothetical protein
MDPTVTRAPRARLFPERPFGLLDGLLSGYSDIPEQVVVEFEEHLTLAPPLLAFDRVNDPTHSQIGERTMRFRAPLRDLDSDGGGANSAAA